jgi:hypothetical protein
MQYNSIPLYKIRLQKNSDAKGAEVVVVADFFPGD